MAGSTTGGSDSSPQDSIFSEIQSFFTSVKTTIALLVLLAAGSIVGTVIPQGLPEQFMAAESPFYYRLSVILDLHGVYRSWWFILLLILLSLNLLGCLLKRLSAIPTEWKGTSRKTSFSFTLSDVRRPEELRGIVTSALKGLIGAPTREADEAGSLSLTWLKHRIYLLGFPFIHLAIIVILLGGLIGLFYGWKGHILIKEGDVGNKFNLFPDDSIGTLPFQIAVDNFTLKRYPTGEPKEYRTDVTLLENGREVKKGSIRVNHPLTYEGISLYQSDYHVLGVKQVRLAVVEPGGKAADLVLRPHSETQVPGSTYEVRLVSLDPGTTERGAGAEITAESAGTQPKSIQLFRTDKSPVKLGDTEIRFLDYRPLYATGLQIGYDPGSTVVWIGCLMLIAGFFLSLFTNQRRLTIRMTNTGTETDIKISGRSRKLRREFRETVKKKVLDGLRTNSP
ncbi:MAG: cytochrome c biogenesis protein ResB [Desulfomonilaceae bacterium]